MDPGCTPSYVNGYTSVIEYPAPDDEYYLIKDVPHGEVREHWFYSDVTKSYRRMYVYTPPDYETNTGTRYPVLYLRMEQVNWKMMDPCRQGKFYPRQSDSREKACSMIIVMNLGFASYPEQAGQILSGNSRWAAFEEMLIDEVIPDVDAFYRTIPNGRTGQWPVYQWEACRLSTSGSNVWKLFTHRNFQWCNRLTMRSC